MTGADNVKLLLTNISGSCTYKCTLNNNNKMAQAGLTRHST